MPDPRRGRASAVSAMAGAVLAFVLVSTAMASPAPLPWEHYTCVRGSLVTTQYNWTPRAIVNSPFGGWGNDSWGYEVGGRGQDLSQNGEATMVFDMLEWNLSTVNRELVSGLGQSEACPMYEVNPFPNLPPWQQSSGCFGCRILGPGNTTDASEATQFNVSLWGGTGSAGATSVIFHNEFVTSNAPSVSTCGGPAQQHNLTIAGFTFQLPFRTSHGELIFNESVTQENVLSPTLVGDYSEQFGYWFPADCGTWQIDNLSAPGGPGGGWAFSYSPCS